MKTVTLLFPDNTSIFDFALQHKVKYNRESPEELSITCTVTNEQLSEAFKKYRAYVMKIVATA